MLAGLVRRFPIRAAASCTAGAAAAATAAASSAAAVHSDEQDRSAQAQWSLWRKPPPFTADALSRFDMSVYAGRALHFVDVLGDLSMILVTTAECEEAVALQNNRPAAADDAQLWRAAKVKAACVHPDTGDVIPAPFRFCAFAPANLVICGGLLWASGVSLRASALWQWLNQSYNVCVNHCNRGSGSPPPERLATAYVGATLTSVSGAPHALVFEPRTACEMAFLSHPSPPHAVLSPSPDAVAIGLQHVGSKLQGSARLVTLLVPMVGVSFGAVVNLVMTRRDELALGLALFDEAGRPLGSSALAAQTALAQCAATRVAWTVALLTVAPLVSGVALRALPASAPRLASTALDLGVTFGVIWLCVPLCLALFPQHTSARASTLEERFHEGPPTVYFNKGL